MGTNITAVRFTQNGMSEVLVDAVVCFLPCPNAHLYRHTIMEDIAGTLSAIYYYYYASH